MVQVLPHLYFQANFLTVRPNATNDMALEILWKCATFSSWKFFPNFEWFKSNLENGPSPTEFVFSS